MNEKPWSPATVASDHRLVALDANVLIYVLEGNEEFGARARAVVDAVDAGVLAVSMATVGQVEILAGPARIGDAGVFERTADEIRSLGITLVPLTSAVAEDAAWIRGSAGGSAWPTPSTWPVPARRERRRSSPTTAGSSHGRTSTCSTSTTWRSTRRCS